MFMNVIVAVLETNHDMNAVCGYVGDGDDMNVCVAMLEMTMTCMLYVAVLETAMT